MVKAIGFNGCKISLASTSIQYLNTMIIYMVIIINVFIFIRLPWASCAVAPSGRGVQNPECFSALFHRIFDVDKLHG